MAAWYDDVKLKDGLLEALVNADVLTDAEEFKEFARKPQKYNEHYEAWKDAGYPTDESDDGWEEFSDTFSSEEEDESET